MGDWRVPGYRELRELGAGAQGRVVLALHEESGTPVAIKYLSARADGAALAALRREAGMLARVESPHVARLYRLVEGPDGSAIVMEAVDGVPLKRILAEHGALEPRAALTVLKGSLLGLAAAHGAGVVHRDYKPANVVVPADGRSKLIDFGIASGTGTASRSGTPQYMAPEQWHGGQAGPATDVYAATCVFYECVTGRRPFQADDIAGLRDRHLNEPVPLEELPEPLRPLVAKGMAKDPGERQAGAAGLVQDLETAARAAYGDDWEARGVRTLAMAAAALSALFPLAAAALPVPATAAGSGASSSAALAKVAVAGAAAVALAAAGVVAYQATRPEAARTEAAQGPVITVASLDRAYPDRVLRVQGAQYVQVGKMKDGATQSKANRALRVPLEQAITYYQEWGRSPAVRSACGTRMNVLGVRVTIGLRGPNLVSARYVPTFQRNCGKRQDYHPGFGVTVDLRSGRALTPDDIFKPSTFTKPGMQRLWDNLPEGKDKQQLLINHSGPGGFISPLDRDAFFSPIPREPAAPPEAIAIFDRQGLNLLFGAQSSDIPDPRGSLHRTAAYSFAVPYLKARDLLNPELLNALPTS